SDLQPTPALSYSFVDLEYYGSFATITEHDPFSSLEGEYAQLTIVGTDVSGAPTMAFMSETTLVTASVNPPPANANTAIGATLTRDQTQLLAFLDDGSIYAGEHTAAVLQDQITYAMEGGAEVKKPTA